MTLMSAPIIASKKFIVSSWSPSTAPRWPRHVCPARGVLAVAALSAPPVMAAMCSTPCGGRRAAWAAGKPTVHLRGAKATYTQHSRIHVLNLVHASVYGFRYAQQAIYCRVEQNGTGDVTATSSRRDHRKSKSGLRHDVKLIELYVMTKSEF